MKDPVIIIGIGEMGGVFARGLLRLGHPVLPVTREIDINEMARDVPAPALVLIAVAEKDLAATLATIPEAWRPRLALLQNELLPRDWEAHDIHNPTVVAVWFEKKPGQDFKVLVPSPVYGPHASLLVSALGALDIPAWEVTSEQEMLYELVRKNIYILTTNIAGMEVGGTVRALWDEHQPLAREVAAEVMAIQFWLTGRQFDPEQLIAGMVAGIEGDPEHKCMGRSAPARLARAIAFADDAGLAVPKLRHIQLTHGA